MGSGADPEPGHQPGPQGRWARTDCTIQSIRTLRTVLITRTHLTARYPFSLHTCNKRLTCCCSKSEQSWRETGSSARLSRLVCRPIIDSPSEIARLPSPKFLLSLPSGNVGDTSAVHRYVLGATSVLRVSVVRASRL
eukprot:3686045-Pleurochrysis_carterae.AAC.1